MSISEQANRVGQTAAVLFDLGNTLAAYYRRGEFGPVLERSLASAATRLRAAGVAAAAPEVLLERALRENREAPDHRFAPMRDRLARIFDLRVETAAALGDQLCGAFLGPIFATGRVYDETPAALAAAKALGFKTGIVSNAPWGSPPELWRAELERLALSPLVDAIVLCGDVGWRKPAARIFEHSAAVLGVRCEQCVFVGDDPEWDIAGSAAVGMRPVLLDRDGLFPAHAGARIKNLSELASLLA